MYGKIQITGKVELVTGMHIGGSDAFAAIGAMDSPVIRDVRTNRPLLPGSSFKGKLRSLLAKAHNEIPVKHEDDAPLIRRLFGSAGKNGQAQPARLLVADMFVTPESEAATRKEGISGFTEIKFENTINRLTAVANPRQIERVIRGLVFGLDMIYELTDVGEAKEDFALLGEGLKLLEYDYLGGHGSRGYGKVRLREVAAEGAAGEYEPEAVEELNAILQAALGEK